MKLYDVMVVDDQPLFIDGIKALNQRINGFKIIGDACNGKDLIKKLDKQLPEVILLDIEMPVMDGMETTRYLHEFFPQIKIVILTGHNEQGVARKCLADGAHGYLQKHSNIETIAEAVRDVMHKGYYLNSTLKRHLDEIKETSTILNEQIVLKVKVSILSEREMEILKLIMEELSNQDIADKLFLSVKTIEAHKANIVKKTNSKTIIGAVIYAVNQGWI